MAYTSVKGEVTRTFFEGKGAEVTEAFTVKGRDIKKRWTAWFDNAHGLNVGDAVEVSGLHSDDVDEWADKTTGEARHSVKRSLNKASVKSQSVTPAAAEFAPDTDYPF